MEFPERVAVGGIEKYEQLILDALSGLGIIGLRFTGSVVLHLNEGKICDFEKTERSLKKKLNRQHKV